MHDCAKGKHLYASEMLKLCRQYQLEISETEEKDPYLLHGKLGAYFCEHKYKIKNPEILSAIIWHTTGRPDMTLMEKIVFVADYIEPGRDKAPNLDDLRRLAFEDIDEAVYEITKNTLVSSNISIKEVAWSSGFQDEKYFLKLFKKKEGMTPSEYRNAFFSKKLNNDIVP